MSFVLKFFRALLLFVLALAIVAGAGLCYCAFDRTEILDATPAGQKIFASSEKIYDAAIPLLDLRAADVLFADPRFSGYRGAFMALRQSQELKNPLVRLALNRKAALSFYKEGEESSFVCAVDLGVLSAATRLSPILAPRLLNVLPKEKTKNISWNDGPDAPKHFKIASENSALYAAPCKNLLLVSGSLEGLESALKGGHKGEYSEEERALFCEKRSEPFCVIADANELAEIFLEDKSALEFVLPLLKRNAKSALAFSIDDSLLKANASLPLQTASADSTLPQSLLKFSDRVQYYTILNAGTLQELKEAAFPILEKSGTDASRMWQKADGLCRAFFSLSLDELLFSWTGSEFAVFGIEGTAEPVFAAQIKDEGRRKRVFDALTSSVILKENESLLVGGLRLPYIDMPGFLRGLLRLFNVELPKPYYLVKDGFLYLSESPQNLAAVYEASQTGKVLAAEKKWRELSRDMEANSSVALYYNLARSVPFFLQKRNTLTEILSLYNIGRADFAVKNGSLNFSLRAGAMESKDSRLLPGFPLKTEGVPDGNLVAEDGKKCGAVFWTEDGNSIHSLELSSMKRASLQMERLSSIAAAKKSSGSKGVLWAVTDDGAIYLLTRDLRVADGFPKIAGIRPAAAAVSSQSGELLVPCEDGTLYRLDGGQSERIYFDGASFKSAPACLENYAAIYDKGFLGKIYVSKNSEWDLQNAFDIDGIAFGSPCLAKGADGSVLAAFITQNGTFYLFSLDEKKIVSGFPIETGGLFFSNAVHSGGSFFALSADAALYKIGMDGSVVVAKVPDEESAERGVVRAMPGGVSVCADKNVLWAWTSALEVAGGFPVAGFGAPIIADVNGDKKLDCLVLSRDNNLYAWNGVSLGIKE